MKIKSCFAACVAAFALMGCNEKVHEVSYDDEMVQLTVDVSDPATKLSGTYVDKKVNNVQLFVFDKLGVLETQTESTSTSISVQCRNGIKNIVALVNAEKMVNVTTLEDLSHRKANLMTVSEGNEVMVGSKLDTLKTSKKIALKVSRLVAKVSITQIEVALKTQAYLNKEVKLKAIYLVNAAGERCYLSDEEPSFWYNEGGYQPDNCPSVIYEDLNDEVIISGKGARYKEHYFYCYPNGLGSKQTRLVVETEIDNEIFYYPINMGVIEPGHYYRCYLLITRLGSFSPDVPVEEVTANTVVSVTPWVYDDALDVEI